MGDVSHVTPSAQCWAPTWAIGTNPHMAGGSAGQEFSTTYNYRLEDASSSNAIRPPSENGQNSLSENIVNLSREIRSMSIIAALVDAVGNVRRDTALMINF